MKIASLALLAFAGSALGLGPIRSADNVQRRQEPGFTYEPHYFDQPIDHFPNSDRYKEHDKGTFKQRYYYDSKYYKPGGPVFLYIGGEVSGISRFDNLQTGIIQIMMQATNGLGVILENRYYGESYPYNTTTTDQLAYLTTEQTIADNELFARKATFPGVTSNTSLNAPTTPWILYGGSLAGAQTAFSIKQYPETLYGGIAASGVIHAVIEYPEWYSTMQKYAPQDCVASINGIIANFDDLVHAHNRPAVDKFKSLFGLESIQDDRDFARAIAFPLGGPDTYPTNTWQELNWNSSYGSDDFFNFCDNVTNIYARESIRQVDYALAEYTHGAAWHNLGNYAAYVKRVVLPYCTSGVYNSTNDNCFGTQNQSYWADPTNSDARSYTYSTCTEQGAYQIGFKNGPKLLSDVVQVDYQQQWCTWAFPAGRYNTVPSQPNTTRYAVYGDFDFHAERLAFIDGDQDVWNDLCYHSTKAPPRTSSSNASQPELLISGSGHHWDSYGYGLDNVANEPQFIREAHKWEIRQVQQWLRDFPKWKPKPAA